MTAIDLPVGDAVAALEHVPSDEATSAAIAALTFTEVATIVRALDRRLALIAGRWLIEQRRKHMDGDWGEVLVGLAESFERAPSTLRRWMAEAAQHFGILDQLPAQGSAARSRARRGEDAAIGQADPGRPPQRTLFDPETVEDVRTLGTVATKLPAQRWAEALSVSEIEGLIGVLRAARSEALRRAAIGTGAVEGAHEHQWKKVQASFGGFIWKCTAPDCTETKLTKPVGA